MSWEKHCPPGMTLLFKLFFFFFLLYFWLSYEILCLHKTFSYILKFGHPHLSHLSPLSLFLLSLLKQLTSSFLPQLPLKHVERNHSFKKKKTHLFCLVCMSVSLYGIYLLCACLVPRRSGEGSRSPRTGIMGGCMLPRKCWDSDLGPLHKQ